jgi:hypothetical protein
MCCISRSAPDRPRQKLRDSRSLTSFSPGSSGHCRHRTSAAAPAPCPSGIGPANRRKASRKASRLEAAGAAP